MTQLIENKRSVPPVLDTKKCTSPTHAGRAQFRRKWRDRARALAGALPDSHQQSLESADRLRYVGFVMAPDTYDVICIGAGPTGLACAIEAKRAGMRPLVIDKGALCNSLLHYPINMLFFTTPERMEIGDLPMTTAGGKPTRAEALKYYRRAVEHYGIETKLYEHVDRTEGGDGNFEVHTRDASGARKEYRTRKIIIATGYYDLPNFLGIPGE